MENMKKTAGLLQAQGRHGDTILAHINPKEAKMLKAAGGSGTINPETGLPEYFSLSGLFKTAAVAVGAYFLGPAIGLSSAVTTGAVTGAVVSGVTGGNPLKGALLGGVTGGITNFIAGGGLSDPSNWMAKMGESFVGNAPGNQVFGEAAKSVAGTSAQQAGIRTLTPTEFLNAGTPGGSIPSLTDTAINNAIQPTVTATPSFSMNEVAGYNRAAANIPQPGLLSRMGTWANENPVPALMVGQSVMSGIGGMAQAEANAEQAQANRDLNLQLHTVQGGFANPYAVTVNDPNLVTDVAGRYIRGPRAGQYAPGRAPGLLNTARA